ncbi:MAG TPA: PIN domain-containing protein [Polyangia bacterium]|nr:PIN domain-containing protein [Polyangia bacterium]
MNHLYLLDTDIIIFLLRGTHPAIADRVRLVGDRRIAAAAITFADLYYGAWCSTRVDEGLRAVDQFRRRVRMIPFDRRAAVLFGRLKSGLRGHAPGDSDLFIAATALAADAVLVTNNLRHFAAIDGLAVESWVTPAPAGAPSAPRRRKPRA